MAGERNGAGVGLWEAQSNKVGVWMRRKGGSMSGEKKEDGGLKEA